MYSGRVEPVLVSLSDSYLSRSLTMDLIFIFISYFYFLFYFSFPFLFFSFSIFRITWVRGYQSRCHISHNWMA